MADQQGEQLTRAEREQLETELAELAATGDPRVRADALAAAALGAAAARGAVALVTVNLTAVEGDPRIAEAEQLAAAAEHSATRVH